MIAHIALVCALLTTQHYDVSLTDRDLGSGSRGTLDLQIAPNGIVTGYYRTMSGGGGPRTVAGGRKGSAIWFDIGDLRFTGTLGAGGISGHAFRDGSSTEYVLKAVSEQNL